jgi:hypothetical protein
MRLSVLLSALTALALAEVAAATARDSNPTAEELRTLQMRRPDGEIAARARYSSEQDRGIQRTRIEFEAHPAARGRLDLTANSATGCSIFLFTDLDSGWTGRLENCIETPRTNLPAIDDFEGTVALLQDPATRIRSVFETSDGLYVTVYDSKASPLPEASLALGIVDELARSHPELAGTLELPASAKSGISFSRGLIVDRSRFGGIFVDFIAVLAAAGDFSEGRVATDKADLSSFSIEETPPS